MSPPTDVARHEPEALEEELGRLVHRRQELRTLRAERHSLEANRQEIVRLQRLLSAALIARHLRTA